MIVKIAASKWMAQVRRSDLGVENNKVLTRVWVVDLLSFFPRHGPEFDEQQSRGHEPHLDRSDQGWGGSSVLFRGGQSSARIRSPPRTLTEEDLSSRLLNHAIDTICVTYANEAGNV